MAAVAFVGAWSPWSGSNRSLPTPAPRGSTRPPSGRRPPPAPAAPARSQHPPPTSKDIPNAAPRTMSRSGRAAARGRCVKGDVAYILLTVVVFGLMFAYVAWARRFGGGDDDRERP
jgi:hypothetical protein